MDYRKFQKIAEEIGEGGRCECVIEYKDEPYHIIEAGLTRDTELGCDASWYIAQDHVDNECSFEEYAQNTYGHTKGFWIGRDDEDDDEDDGNAESIKVLVPAGGELSQPKFKVGDKVRVKKKEDCDLEIENQPDWVDAMDKFEGEICEVIEGNSENGNLHISYKKDSWYFHPSWLEAIETDTTPQPYHNLIIHCPTQEEYNAINKLIGWKMDKSNREIYWEVYKEETGVVCEEGNINGYANIPWYKANAPYKDYTFKTAKEVLAEAGVEIQNLAGDKGRWMEISGQCCADLGDVPSSFRGIPIFVDDEHNINNNKEEKPMLKELTQALKRVLKGDLRKQYRGGMINSDSSLTCEGREVMEDALSQLPEVQKALTARADEVIKEAKDK